MHSILTGYKVAGQLAPVVAADPAELVDTLHRLALLIADRCVKYSFEAP
jgi:hypothetical protein